MYTKLSVQISNINPDSAFQLVEHNIFKEHHAAVLLKWKNYCINILAKKTEMLYS